MRIKSRSVALLTAAALGFGCASHGPTHQMGSRAAAGPGNTVVTAAELSRYSSRANLMEALERVRPSFLYPRGSAPLVSIDGSVPTDLAILSTIPTSTVAEVRLLRASSSVGKPTVLANGDVVVGDVILVLTRAGERP